MGLWTLINQHLVLETRELEGKDASPTADVIDSQSVKTTESGGIRDTLGLMVGLMVHSAEIQDRDGAPALLTGVLNRMRRHMS